MKVKVRHGMVRWIEKITDAQGTRPVVRTAFRAMTVDIPDDEAKRLLGEGAVIPENAELTKGGRMSPLPSTASDEELKAWVSVANAGDIEKACSDNPKIADRIRNARKLYENELAAQNQVQGGSQLTPLKDRPEGPGHGDDEDGIENLTPEPPKNDGSDDDDDKFSDLSDLIGDRDVTGDHGDPDTYDKIVDDTVGNISEYLSENPDHASQVLEAENRRAERRGDANPRPGVVKAVEVASSHASQ